MTTKTQKHTIIRIMLTDITDRLAGGREGFLCTHSSLWRLKHGIGTLDTAGARELSIAELGVGSGSPRCGPTVCDVYCNTSYFFPFPDK